MDEKKQEKLPIDAKLLSDAVIELNISKRSVGLYPADHPITRESVEKAFDHLKRLFDIRGSITIGIAKDTLLIDEYALDRKNPVFKEFALGIHGKGIAAITFYSGLAMEELLAFHGIMTSRESPAGRALVELGERKGLVHIKLTPIDLSGLGFAEGRVREDGSDVDMWANYIAGLLDGTLAEGDAEGVILNTLPTDIASFMNERDRSGHDHVETYDRVIAAYLKRREHPRIRSELLSNFISLVDNLRPELKQQFLKRAFMHPSMEPGEAEGVMADLSREDLEKIIKVFGEQPTVVPESLRNLLDKLNMSKNDRDLFNRLPGEKAVLDDILIDENILKLFGEDHFQAFVPGDYRHELELMLKGGRFQQVKMGEEAAKECRPEIIEWKSYELLIELSEADLVTRDDYLRILGEITRIVNDLLETGRFAELTEIYNAVYSHALAGRFRDEAASMLEYFFHSETFIKKMTAQIKIWGRLDREGVQRLVNVQKNYLIAPLFEALTEERDAAVRKFLLLVLIGLGRDAVVEAVRRLNDSRWYVVRNMIYIIREAEGIKYVQHIRRFARDENKRIRMEAVRTLIHLKAPDAMSYLKLCLKSDDADLRDPAVRLAGICRYREAVPYLLDLLNRRAVLGAEADFKISIIKALGEIGDPAAIASLVQICKSTSILHNPARERLKVEIFRSLSRYPRDELAPLLKEGTASRDKEIRTISEALLGGRGDREAEDGKDI